MSKMRYLVKIFKCRQGLEVLCPQRPSMLGPEVAWFG